MRPVEDRAALVGKLLQRFGAADRLDGVLALGNADPPSGQAALLMNDSKSSATGNSGTIRPARDPLEGARGGPSTRRCPACRQRLKSPVCRGLSARAGERPIDLDRLQQMPELVVRTGPRTAPSVPVVPAPRRAELEYVPVRHRRPARLSEAAWGPAGTDVRHPVCRNKSSLGYWRGVHSRRRPRGSRKSPRGRGLANET